MICSVRKSILLCLLEVLLCYDPSMSACWFARHNVLNGWEVLLLMLPSDGACRHFRLFIYHSFSLLHLFFSPETASAKYFVPSSLGQPVQHSFLPHNQPCRPTVLGVGRFCGPCTDLWGWGSAAAGCAASPPARAAAVAWTPPVVLPGMISPSDIDGPRTFAAARP